MNEIKKIERIGALECAIISVIDDAPKYGGVQKAMPVLKELFELLRKEEKKASK